MGDIVKGRTIRDAYEELDAIVGARGHKKLANNTYARRDLERLRIIDGTPTAVLVVRHHDTDIIEYRPADRDGPYRVTVRNGGWYSMTTAGRFRDWLPAGYSVSTPRGFRADRHGWAPRWDVYGPTGRMRRIEMYGGTAYEYPETAPLFDFFNGMTFTDTPRLRMLNRTANPYRQAPRRVAKFTP